MRKVLPDKFEAGRIRSGPMRSDPADGLNGAFVIVYNQTGASLRIIASEGNIEFPWEHVSVSISHRTPNWGEMCFVKDAFFEDDDCVVQYHPPKSAYVNNHPFCLHMFRHKSSSFLMPPEILVGIKSEGLLSADRAKRLWEEMRE